jgi:hypothetical protein
MSYDVLKNVRAFLLFVLRTSKVCLFFPVTDSRHYFALLTRIVGWTDRFYMADMSRVSKGGKTSSNYGVWAAVLAVVTGLCFWLNSINVSWV